MAVIVGLNGPHGCGKSLIADMLTQHGFTAASFSGVIKNRALTIDPMVDGQYLADLVAQHGWGPVKERTGVRAFLNDLGCTIRALDPHYVTRSALTSGARVVIDDVYLDHEAQWVHDHGGVMVRVQRPGVEFDGSLYQRGVSCDVTLNNNTSLPVLATKVQELAAHTIGEQQ